jgi:hypothetical protein
VTVRTTNSTLQPAAWAAIAQCERLGMQGATDERPAQQRAGAPKPLGRHWDALSPDAEPFLSSSQHNAVSFAPRHLLFCGHGMLPASQGCQSRPICSGITLCMQR